ncbi:MAG: hypothetical protein JWN41_1542, partial [Thermoleophilia bacterium]|nr:hypothetical protein [Thermoleophilia bacterium]
MPTPTPNADRHVAAGRFVSTRPPDLIVAAIVLTAIVAMWLLAPLAPQPDTVSQFRWAAYLTTGIFSLLL